MQRGVYVIFKSFCSPQAGVLLWTHSHPCIPALPGRLLLLHGSFPVGALTSELCWGSLPASHKAILPHKVFLNSPGWLSELALALCIWPHMRCWLKVIPKISVCPFSLCWCKAMHRSFLGRNKSFASLFIVLLHWMFLFPISLLSVLNWTGGNLFVCWAASTQDCRTRATRSSEIQHYFFTYTLHTSKNPGCCSNYNQQMETINKASINPCSPYTILSKETSEGKEILPSTNVRYIHWRHSLRGKHGRIL